MKPLDWMPWSGDDFWESDKVALMSDSAALLYAWLIWRQFKHGDLPPPQTTKLLVPGRFAPHWEQLWQQIADCFKVVDGGRLRNLRCHKDRTEALAAVERASKHGRAGGRASARKRAQHASNPGSSERSTHVEPEHQQPSSSDITLQEKRTHPSGVSRAHTRARPDALDPLPPAGPSLMDEALRMHEKLDTPEVRAALIEFEAHRSGRGDHPWTKEAWARNCHAWERKGAAWLMAACATAIEANKGTPFESTVNGNGVGPDRPLTSAEVPRSGLLEMPRTNRGGR